MASRARVGRLEVICGPMFSGKSDELLRRARRAVIARERVVLLKPASDARSSVREIVSRAGTRMQAVPLASAAELMTAAGSATFVAIDEAQFFGDDVVPTILQLVDNGTTVVAAGVELDFLRRPWGSMPILLAVAERVDKLQAVCERCGADASFTQRLIDGEPAPVDDPLFRLGSHELYEARCRGCFVEAPTSIRLSAESSR